MTGQEKHDPGSPAGKLSEAADEFCRFIRELPEAALAEKAWGPKEVLAHLVYWYESYVAQIEALLAEEPFQPPRGRWDDLNALAVEASRGVPVEELLRRLQVASERLCSFAHTRDPESTVLQQTKGSTPHTLAWFAAAEAGHIRHHLRRLEWQASRDPIGEAGKLRATVDEFCRFIRELPGAAVVEQAWGPREVLAHLVFWHERYVAQIEAILAAEPFEVSQCRRDELNAQAVEASRGVSADELLCRFQVADERLRGFGQTLDPQNTILEEHWKGGTWLCTLDDVISRVETHISSHHRELVKERKQKPLNSRVDLPG